MFRAGGGCVCDEEESAAALPLCRVRLFRCLGARRFLGRNRCTVFLLFRRLGVHRFWVLPCGFGFVYLRSGC